VGCHGGGVVQGSGANGNSYRVFEADFGPSLTALSSASSLKLLAANPPDGCLTFAHTTNYAGAVVLIQRDNCTFQTKARRSSTCQALHSLHCVAKHRVQLCKTSHGQVRTPCTCH